MGSQPVLVLRTEGITSESRQQRLQVILILNNNLQAMRQNKSCVHYALKLINHKGNE